MASTPFVARGIVSDLDGTLLDTEPLYFRAYAYVAKRYGHEYTFDTHTHLLGRAEVEGARALIRLLDLPLTPDGLLDIRDEYLVTEMASVTPLPGAVEAMAAIRATGNALMAVATSSCRKYMGLKRERNETLFSLFDSVICGDDAEVGGRSKPDPAIFLAAAKSVGVDPSHCVALEDSLAGIRSARAAGMHVIAVPEPRLDPADVEAAGPHRILKTLEEFHLSMIGLSAPP